MLASLFLTGCPKYKEATVEGKADIIVAKKACAVCTDWKHERPSCPHKLKKPCKKKDCKANHHTTLHGSKNQRVMAIKTNQTSSSSKAPSDPDDYGMLSMLHYISEKVNQGTTVFMD